MGKKEGRRTGKEMGWDFFVCSVYISVFTFSYMIASNHMFSYKLNAYTFVICSLNVIDLLIH